MMLIASSVLEENGMLKKKGVEQLLPKGIKKETQVVEEDTLVIIELFEDDSELEIIVNTFLFPDLHSIVITTTNGLKDANKYIIQNIWNIFLKLLLQRAIKLMTVKKLESGYREIKIQLKMLGHIGNRKPAIKRE
ncbi:hypothetical protein PS15p_206863 [Mucor circinelloides]